MKLVAGLPLGVPTPRSAIRRAGAMADFAFAVPAAAAVIVQALPQLTEAALRLVDEHGPLRQLDDAIIGLAELQRVVTALDKIVLLSTALEKLSELEDELHTLGQLEESLEKIAGFSTVLEEIAGPIKALAQSTASLPELAAATESLPELVVQVRAVEAIVAHMDTSLDGLTPTLNRIVAFGDNLGAEIDDLGDSLAPISRIASRLPGSKKRAREREQDKG